MYKSVTFSVYLGLPTCNDYTPVTWLPHITRIQNCALRYYCCVEVVMCSISSSTHKKVLILKSRGVYVSLLI